MTHTIGRPEDFDDIIWLIESARASAYQAVNASLIDLYWQVGASISDKIASAQWGDGVVEQLALHLERTQPNLGEIYPPKPVSDAAIL